MKTTIEISRDLIGWSWKVLEPGDHNRYPLAQGHGCPSKAEAHLVAIQVQVAYQGFPTFYEQARSAGWEITP